MTVFFSWQFWWPTRKGPRAEFSSPPEVYEKPESWYQKRPLVLIHFLGSLGWIWISLSWSSDLWLRSWFLIWWGYSSYLPPLTRILVGSRWEDTGKYPPRLGWKIPREFPPSWKALKVGGSQLWTPRAWLKHSKKTPTYGKAQVGAGSVFTEKNPGLGWKTPRWLCCRKM